MENRGEPALYKQVAERVENLIRSGTLLPGDRLPSLRKASQQHGVSLTTAIEAYLELENRRLIEARPKSGYYVRSVLASEIREPTVSRPSRVVGPVSVGILESRLFEATLLKDVISFGGAAPAPEFLPTEKLNRILGSLSRSAGKRGVSYDMPPGSLSLRREIAKRALDAGANLSPEEIVITSGATEALMLCLRAVASRGEVVAVESPAYFGVLHALEVLGVKALEIPMHPRTGLDLDFLEKATKTARLAACVAVPSFSNPLGSLMPDENKERLVQILAQREIPLIEDDVFGELHFGPVRPRLARSYDTKGLVLFCGSFSKTLAPGYRVGWVAPGRFYSEVKALKLVTTLATATLPEMAIAEFLSTGGYDHYLRSVRVKYEESVRRMSDAVINCFPPDIKITRPQGGFVLWVELPAQVDALQLDDIALADKISVAPGPMFSSKQGYKNFVRLSCALPWTKKVEEAVVRLGRIVRMLNVK